MLGRIGVTICLSAFAACAAAGLPHFNAAGQLLVQGRPFLIRGVS